MADKKISQLSSASALTGAEPLAIVQDGVTKKTTVQDVADLSVLFPNGLKEVPTSRDFEASDVGYILAVTAQDVALTFPEISPFSEGQIFGVLSTNEGCTIELKYLDEAPLNTLGATTNSECLIFKNIDSELFLLNCGIIYDADDSTLKTANRYFYDKITAL